MNPWFRFYHEFASDAKVQSMSEAMQRRLVMVLCYQCSGELQRLDDELLCFAMRVTPEQLAETKELFLKKGFIKNDWTVKNWDKRQFKSDASKERTRTYRNKGDRHNAVTTPSRRRHNAVTVTPPDTDTEADTEADSETEFEEEENREPAKMGPAFPVVKAKPNESLAWVDRLSEKILEWFPGRGWDARVYEIASWNKYSAEAVEYGFDEAYQMTLRGDTRPMSEDRIIGLIQYAEDRGLSIGVGQGSVVKPKLLPSQTIRPNYYHSYRLQSKAAEMKAGA